MREKNLNFNRQKIFKGALVFGKNIKFDKGKTGIFLGSFVLLFINKL